MFVVARYSGWLVHSWPAFTVDHVNFAWAEEHVRGSWNSFINGCFDRFAMNSMYDVKAIQTLILILAPPP
jgi:hypothetical protein